MTIDLRLEVAAAVALGVTKDDVTIDDRPPDVCPGCGETTVSKVVSVDLRAIGRIVQVDVYCGSCAIEVADTLRAGLPDEDGVTQAGGGR